MAIQVTIENITGQTPYDIYICQTGGTGCFYMTTISSVPYSFDIPSPYDTSLAYMVKIIDNNGCVISGQSSVLSVCPSPTPTPSNTATPTVTPTITPSSVTPTPTPTNTKTPTPTKTATPTITPTKTATPTPTPTNTPTVTPTKTQTPTVTPTQTKTPTVTPTNTVTPTVTPTNTKTPTPTPTPTSTSAAIVCTSCVQLSGGTINGITVGVSYSGDVATYTFGPTTGCTSVFTPADSILVGQFSNFSLTFSFSQPVNDLLFYIDGYQSPETFTFTTNTGTPTISSPENCDTLIVGNQISSTGVLSSGKFIINNISDYTSLTITGPGGAFGSTVALCTDSIV